MIEIMTKISAADVGKLRKATGAGMMDCKKALVEAEGDFDKAIEVLRKKGQKVALVGQSGGGKTTLADLLPRFYDLENGEIKIDDINIKDIVFIALHAHVVEYPLI